MGSVCALASLLKEFFLIGIICDFKISIFFFKESLGSYLFFLYEYFEICFPKAKVTSQSAQQM